MSTVTICAFVKWPCLKQTKSFLRRNGLRLFQPGRFTEDFRSAVYTGAEYSQRKDDVS